MRFFIACTLILACGVFTFADNQNKDNDLAFTPPAEIPGGSPNEPLIVQWDKQTRTLEFIYSKEKIFEARVRSDVEVSESTMINENRIEQRIFIKGENIELLGKLHAGPEAVAAETRGNAQKKFPLVRTSLGISTNLRNNAIYDRTADWMIQCPQENTRIVPLIDTPDRTTFNLTIEGEEIEIIFRPRYYQKHKNLPYYQPWTYKVRRDSITGWCSWWAYYRDFNQENLEELLGVWKTKRLNDYGYNFIQIDDGYQGALDADRKMPENAMKNYIGGRPETWLNWRKNLFPDGMEGYINSVRKAGFKPGVWLGCFFTDLEIAQQHPDWFVRGKDGKPFVGDWVTYAIDTTNPEAADTLVRPTYKGLADAGFKYVKIDQLRHYLYDNIHLNLEYCKKQGVRPDELYRSYLKIARTELGPDTFILSCWGVLPESIGIADACRIGGDGYGPVTMQQYNSWNGIVWRNDPDHCDVFPKYKPAEVGNVLKTEKIQAANNDTIIRPALASIAGCMLMLSDKPEVYRDDRNLVGTRKSAPVLFSVPGQLYDFDEVKTKKLLTTDRLDIKSGSGVSPIDGDQFGQVCPWWLNEFDRPFEHWNVLHRLNWSEQNQPEAAVSFADLGLDPSKKYLVYEFWKDRFVGLCEGSFEAAPQEPMQLDSYAIRELLDRPQIVSTNRHLSQGAAELAEIKWDAKNTLTGRSKVIAEDKYVITLYVPEGYKLTNAEITGYEAEVISEGPVVRIGFSPTVTELVEWSMKFQRQ